MPLAESSGVLIIGQQLPFATRMSSIPTIVLLNSPRRLASRTSCENRIQIHVAVRRVGHLYMGYEGNIPFPLLKINMYFLYPDFVTLERMTRLGCDWLGSCTRVTIFYQFI